MNISVLDDFLCYFGIYPAYDKNLLHYSFPWSIKGDATSLESRYYLLSIALTVSDWMFVEKNISDLEKKKVCSVCYIFVLYFCAMVSIDLIDHDITRGLIFSFVPVPTQ